MKWIDARLKHIHRSKKELASFLNLSQPRISDLIAGRRRLLAKEVLSLALFLGLHPVTVLMLCDEKENAKDFKTYKELLLGSNKGT